MASWWPVLFLPFLGVTTLSLRWPDAWTGGGPLLLFLIVVVAASLCAVAAGLLLWKAHRSDTAELSWIALFFLSCSLLPLVHGVTTPGVWYGPNEATVATVALAIPVGLAAASPLALGRFHPIARRWRSWALVWVGIMLAGCAVFLAFPDLIPAPDGRAPIGIALILASVAGCVAIGRRQMVMADIAQRPGPLVIAAGAALVGATPGVLFGASPYSIGFWVAHAVDITGVFAAVIGAMAVYRRSASMTEVLAPVVAVDPIAALEVGMHPAVIEFVHELDAKDQMTRDHVVRTAELAIEVAAAMGLGPDAQREAGLVGALHDIGKLEIPGEILTKNSSLTDDEWLVMRRHPELGAAILLDTPQLASLAPGVRAHHERHDGRGYPDGLAGDEIPLVARIVSACDAFDAMAYSRHYRTGMSTDVVISELRAHAGEQWDPQAVMATIAVVERRQPTEPRLFASSGQSEQLGDYACDCLR